MKTSIAFVALMVTLASSQCNYYKTSSGSSNHYPVGRCLQASTYSPISTNDVMLVCHANGTMTRYDYNPNSGCTGASIITQVTTAGQFSCGGTNCYVQYEYGSTSFLDWLSFPGNCTSTSPPVFLEAVPGLCAATRKTIYCAAGGAYVAETCSVTNSTAAGYLPFGQCNENNSGIRIKACMGGPSPPTGAYFTANSYANCNFYDVNGTRGPIDVCEDSIFISSKARCTDANTLEVGTFLGLGCSGTPSVSTYTRGTANVDFLCTGNQCLIEKTSYSTSSTCTGSSTKRTYPAGKCTTGEDIFYCYDNNNKIFRERYQFSYSSTTCDRKRMDLGTVSSSVSSKIINAGVCIGSSSTSEMWTCSLGGATPPFGSVGAGNRVAVNVALYVVAAVLGALVFM